MVIIVVDCLPYLQQTTCMVIEYVCFDRCSRRFAGRVMVLQVAAKNFSTKIIKVRQNIITASVVIRLSLNDPTLFIIIIDRGKEGSLCQVVRVLNYPYPCASHHPFGKRKLLCR